MNREYIHDLRVGFVEDGGVWVWGENNRGGAAEGAKVGKGAKITLEHMKSVRTMMDEVYSEGKVVVANMVVAHILKEFDMEVHRTTTGRLVKKLGFTWGPIKDQPKNYAAYRTRSIRDYLIDLDIYEGDGWRR